MNEQLSILPDEPDQVSNPRAALITKWMHGVSGSEWRWFIKVLRGNDTVLTNAHQAGPYVSRRILFELFPSVEANREEKSDRTIHCSIDSHDLEREVSARWYPSKQEAHLTGWGGRSSPLLDPESTGAVVVMAFHQRPGHDADELRVWLCETAGEEDEVAARVGVVEPGVLVLYDPSRDSSSVPETSPCQLPEASIPPEWRTAFPSAAELIEFALGRATVPRGASPDERLLRRRECEYELFRSIERVLVLPGIAAGFSTVDEFVDFANAVTNRRKSRSGSSLGLQTSRIFTEEHLPHSYDGISEGRKRPDFLFPSSEAYRASSGDKLRMLAAKTTCKDRWRQILNEADKLRTKHLLTLQEGVSLTQFEEMSKAGVVLVIPREKHAAFHSSIRPHLVTLEEFIAETRAVCS